MFGHQFYLFGERKVISIPPVHAEMINCYVLALGLEVVGVFGQGWLGMRL